MLKITDLDSNARPAINPANLFLPPILRWNGCADGRKAHDENVVVVATREVKNASAGEASNCDCAAFCLGAQAGMPVLLKLATNRVISPRSFAGQWSPLIYNFRHYYRLAETELGKTFRAEA